MSLQRLATTPTGSEFYSRPVLGMYDRVVLGFSNTYVWKSPTTQILEFYNEHISANHLDVGVGTGYFLDRCRFPSTAPSIVLADLNPNTLAVTAARIARYQPQTCVVNVLESLPLAPHSFDSIGLNYVLHCLPGTMREKQSVFRNLKQLLRPGGVLFGTTILSQGVRVGLLARIFMAVYNEARLFGNREDSLQALERNLEEVFDDYSLYVVGSVAFFAARVPAVENFSIAE
ncbi:MAG TPA: class I SAM-dependent methyltransferase [Herpetosiphonaceae bacterium]